MQTVETQGRVRVEDVLPMTPKRELAGAVAKAVEEAPGVVSQFLNNIFGLFAAIAVPFALAYRHYQRLMGSRIEPLLTAFRRDKETLHERVPTMFKAGHDELLAQLKARLRARAIERARRGGEKPVEATARGASTPSQTSDVRPIAADPLAGKRPDRLSAAYAVQRWKIFLGGWELCRIEIPKPLTYLDFCIWVAVLVVVMCLDYLIGFNVWVHESSQAVALSLNLATVAGLTTLSIVAASYLKRWATYRDAVKQFNAHYPDGHPEYFIVAPFPTSAKIVAFGSLATLVFFSVLLLFTRLWLVSTGKGELGGFAGSVALVFAFLVFFIVEFSRANPYTRQQYDAFEQALQRERQETETPVDRNANTAATPLVAASNEQKKPDHPIALYEHGYEELLIQANSNVAQAKDGQRQLVDLLIECQQTWDETEGACLAAFRDVTVVVAREYDAFGEKLGLGTPEADQKMKSQLRSEVKLKYHDSDQLQQIQGHIFKVELPDLQIRDFTKVEEEVNRTLTVPWMGGTVLTIDGRVISPNSSGDSAPLA